MIMVAVGFMATRTSSGVDFSSLAVCRIKNQSLYVPNVGTNLLNSLFGKGAGTPGTSGYIPPGFLPSWNSIFGGSDAASQAAANQDMANVNMGIVDPTGGNTTYEPLPGTDTSLDQGMVG
jgi:hypothetical protein